METEYHYTRPIWLDENPKVVKIIDQRRLPHELVVEELRTVDDAIRAIKEMYVRGAPLIGATAAYAVYLATLNSPEPNISEDYLKKECGRIKSARPTAVNLIWATDRVLSKILKAKSSQEVIETAKREAAKISDEETENCRKIGEHGVVLIEEISRSKKGKTVNILTHCNAGWLACVEYGTAPRQYMLHMTKK